jgi:hypothetical protein
MEHTWSGNVRELENIIRRMVVLADGEQAFEAQLARGRSAGTVHRQPSLSVTESLREIARRGAREAERHALSEVLERVCWNRAEAARIFTSSAPGRRSSMDHTRIEPRTSTAPHWPIRRLSTAGLATVVAGAFLLSPSSDRDAPKHRRGRSSSWKPRSLISRPRWRQAR